VTMYLQAAPNTRPGAPVPIAQVRITRLRVQWGLAIQDGSNKEVQRDVKERGELLCLGFADGALTVEDLGDSAFRA